MCLQILGHSPLSSLLVRAVQICVVKLCAVKRVLFLRKNVGTREWQTAKFARHCVDSHRVEELEWIQLIMSLNENFESDMRLMMRAENGIFDLL